MEAFESFVKILKKHLFALNSFLLQAPLWRLLIELSWIVSFGISYSIENVLLAEEKNIMEKFVRRELTCFD